MSDFLFAMPSFLLGMGAVLDLGGTMEIFNTSSSPENADILAAVNDWSAVGNDIRTAAANTVSA